LDWLETYPWKICIYYLTSEIQSRYTLLFPACWRTMLRNNFRTNSKPHACQICF